MLQGAQFEVKAKRTVIDFCVLISSQVQGKGLLNAIVIKEEGGVNAYDVCMKLKDSGLLVSGVLKALRSDMADWMLRCQSSNRRCF